MSGSVDEETSGITESVDGETGGNYVDSDVDEEAGGSMNKTTSGSLYGDVDGENSGSMGVVDGEAGGSLSSLTNLLLTGIMPQSDRSPTSSQLKSIIQYTVSVDGETSGSAEVTDVDEMYGNQFVSSDEFRCDQCDLVFKYKKNLHFHKQTKHS